ncbi:septal ring lytic transglycosylase RlpA family protein [Adhaeribacter aquaticus]|uniref:septal ring lytic transglycosylase RlpA family protein n=1 Tax=Adhaeribacter aquaticus TaxID=299567 RepID=UPI000479892B|nr:SPOR domain-containing protein [Adhaeribacter aquaticus]
MRITKLHYVFSLLFILFIGLSEAVFAQETGNIQKGSATWYGSRYHGRKTSSGEIYNKNQMTAAHPTLPFDTKVKVTNLDSDKSIIVRINDRGPFGGKGHIIDLSEAAAKKLDVFRDGYAQVEVEILTLPESTEAEDATPVLVTPEQFVTKADSLGSSASISTPYFIIQAGAFADETNAILQSEKLKALDVNLPVALTEELVKGKKVHRVVAGKFTNRAQAEQFKSKLQKKGISGMVKQVYTAS